MDRASLHAKSTLTAHGLTRRQVRSARVEGNDVVVRFMRAATPHEFNICFPDPQAAQRGHRAVMSFMKGPAPRP